jgi:2-polyprenyl-3-methyl-5-hydroxy-6-metoxy-1,4-benzoquinol methylase
MRDATDDDYVALFAGKYMKHKDCFRDYLPVLLERVQGNRVLDVGTGSGRFVDWCLQNGATEAVGIDPCAPETERVVRGRAESLPALSMSWDVVTSFDVLEHLPPDLAIKSVSEHLRVASKHVVCSIANMGDKHVVRGQLVELHLTQQPLPWWLTHFHRAEGWTIRHRICDGGKRFWIIADRLPS